MAPGQDARAGEAAINLGMGMKLRMVRIMHGVTQVRLGQALGVSFQQIQKYGKGMNRISAARIYQVADYLKVPYGVFFEGLLDKSAKNSADLEAAEEFHKKFLYLAASLNAIKDQRLERALLALLKSLGKKN